jgi:hypothetical protein
VDVLAERPANELLILDDQNAGLLHDEIGSSTRTVVP